VCNKASQDSKMQQNLIPQDFLKTKWWELLLLLWEWI